MLQLLTFINKIQSLKSFAVYWEIEMRIKRRDGNNRKLRLIIKLL